MRKFSKACFMMAICIGLPLALGGQKKPVPPPPNAPSLPGQVQRAPIDQRKPAQARPASEEQNKAVVRRVFDDLFSRGRYEAIEEIYAKECPVHFGNRHTRLEESVAEGKGWRQAAPDLNMIVERIEAKGETVTVDWNAIGTHTGKGNGISPTGKRIGVHGKSTFRVVNGKIVEVWNTDHRDELFRQLGVSPNKARLYEMGEDFWFAVNRFFSGKGPVAASVPPSS